MMDDKYKKNFLTNVIVRVDFPNPLKIESLPPDLTKAFLKSFPISEPKKVFELTGEFKIIPKTKIEIETGEETTEWNYYGRDREKRLILQKYFLSITYIKSYKRYDDLKSELLSIISELFKIFSDIQINRLGLRYINEISLDEANFFDWEKYLDRDLLSIFNIAGNKDTIARGLNNLVLNYGNMILNFHYGMHNPDFPAPIRKKIFVLDYDASYIGLQDLKDIESNLFAFHEEIKKLFEENIEDGLREVMYGN